MKRLIILLVFAFICAVQASIINGPIVGSSPPVSSLQETLGTSAAAVSVTDVSGRMYAQSLHTAAANYTLTILKINIARSGAGTAATLTGQIYSDSAGSPGTLLATSINTIQLPTGTTLALQSFNFAGLSIASGTSYWFGVSGDSVSAGNYYNIQGGAAASGTTKGSADGSSWAALGTRKFNMELWGY